MRPEEADAAYLWDMREAAVKILEFTKGMKFEQFSRNELVRFATERQLVMIGEAARRVSDSFKAAHPEIPWRSIIAQRNVLAHEYGEILVERVWFVVANRLPELIKLLDPLIPKP